MTFDQNSNNPFSVMYPIISIADIKEQMKGGLIPAFRDTFIHFLFATLGNEYLLLDFVNSVLENDGQPLIKSITVQNPFNPKTFVVDKNSILDFKAISEDGNVFVVEFQTGERSFFTDRMLYYCSRTYSSQLHEGVAYTLLHRVIGISLVTYILFSNLISPHNSFFLRATSNHDVIFSEGMQMHVLELAEAKVGLFSQLKTNLRCWMIFFYYADKKSEEEMSLLLRDNPRVENAYIEYKRFNASSELRELDEARQKFLHDLATDLEVATDKGIKIGRAEGMEIGMEKGRAEGMEKGRAEGMEKGRAEGMEKGRAEVESEWKNNTIKTIQNMKKFGMPLSDISAITGLSIDEINKLD